MTRVTLVIPVRDDAELLRRCLADVARQSRPIDELIVVDNASDDDSADVARAAGATVLTERVAGIWPAAARGFDAATGDVIARCDADCRLPSDWVERLVAALDARPDAVAVTGPGVFYDLAGVPRLLADVFYMRAYFWSMHGALAGTPLFGSNMGIRRATWRAVRDRVHRDDPEVHDDMDLSLCLDPRWRVVYDRRLRTGISGRPFRSLPAMIRRGRRAVHTLARNWPEQSPWRRWRIRVEDRLDRRRGLRSDVRPTAALRRPREDGA
ncbi:glycosyl transferase family 2 [Diaminobutyricimonas aerilata]|uniref:4,4'-diaponeurosporenoate glycosyltransferase n=1 Tax=Diaminobutyricimonas aerilata TaxID=1162967 RepID=A0A2M9CL29_9MICO|nr:glycosyltransferase family 2 protein [Diaminobutyricimonas aerilata]PJJ72579.1 glycosyl transferase family 2 [Diaminobutyricimonas aerilata]